MQFAEQFENTHGLGGEDAIARRINVLANKGYIKFLRAATRPSASRRASPARATSCVQDMLFATDQEEVDPDTGEVTQRQVRLLPSHYQSEMNHAVLRGRKPRGVGADRPQSGWGRHDWRGIGRVDLLRNLEVPQVPQPCGTWVRNLIPNVINALSKFRKFRSEALRNSPAGTSKYRANSIG
jgi:hypothetical protein